jgi:hypothetical protein
MTGSSLARKKTRSGKQQNEEQEPAHGRNLIRAILV